MPTPTYELLHSTTLASPASSITIGSIEGTYGDLILELSYISDAPSLKPYLTVNSDTGANYNYVLMRGVGGTEVSASRSNENYIFLNENGIGSGEIATSKIQISDYSSTDKHKSMLITAFRVSGNVQATAGRWASTAAITSITLTGGSFEIGTTANLYGVSK